MKIIAPAALAAIISGTAIVAGAVQITPRDPDLAVIRVWSGYGKLTIAAADYLPIGDRAFAQQTAGAVGGVAQGITLTLSGVERAALALLDPDEVRGASVVVYRLIFKGDGKTLLDAHVFDRGRGDTLDTVEKIGGPAAIRYMVESAARGLGRSLARMRSDSDQRLINSSDSYFSRAAYAGVKMLYWGGKKPARAAGAVSGTSGA